MRYCIKTIYWGRYHEMYGDDWVDQEYQHFTDDLNEAITYADDQCKVPKTIQSTVFETSDYEIVYEGTIGLTSSATNSTDQND
jgi:hypothetical protein